MAKTAAEKLEAATELAAAFKVFTTFTAARSAEVRANVDAASSVAAEYFAAPWAGVTPAPTWNSVAVV